MNRPGGDLVCFAQFKRIAQTDCGVEGSMCIVDQRDMRPSRFFYHYMSKVAGFLLCSAPERELSVWVNL